MATTPVVGVAVCVEAFARVLAQGLEHLVTGRVPRGVLWDDHRLRDELAQGVEDVPGFDALTNYDDLRGRRVETARENTEPVEHDALLFGEQRVGPVDGGAQGLLTFH